MSPEDKIKQLEERIARLEEASTRAQGEHNAYAVFITGAWVNLLMNFSDPPSALKQVKANWMATAPFPSRPMQGVDPATAMAISQENEFAHQALWTRIEEALARAREPAPPPSTKP